MCKSCFVKEEIDSTCRSIPLKNAMKLYKNHENYNASVDFPKACPFCKNSFDFRCGYKIVEDQMYCIECGVCGAQGPVKLTLEEAMRMWNREGIQEENQ